MGTNQRSCEAVGCCWSPVNPNPNNLPWCFHPGGPPTPPSPAPAPGPTPKRCAKARPGVDVSGGKLLVKLKSKTQAQCCVACGSSVAPGCTGWVWSGNGPDNEGVSSCQGNISRTRRCMSTNYHSPIILVYSTSTLAIFPHSKIQNPCQ